MSEPVTYTKPFRLRVQETLTERLKVIKVANGYKTDLNDAVYRGRVEFGENDPLPLVSILETPVPLDLIPPPTGSGAAFGEWELLIQGFVQDDPHNPTDSAHLLMADVKQVLAAERATADGPYEQRNILGTKYHQGGCVEDILIGSGSVRPSDDISAVAYFWLKITLKIIEDNTDPYW